MRAVLATLAFVCLAFPAVAQSHHHPPQDAQLHESFYRDLKMPDNPKIGCCSDKDCYPTQAEYRRGAWWAVRREDHSWVRVPGRKVNTEPSPDGRAHLCSVPPSAGAPDPVPFCFVPPGSGV